MVLGPNADSRMQLEQTQSRAPHYVDGSSLVTGSPEILTTQSPVRFDGDGNVQVYLYMWLSNDEALAALRAMGARIEIVQAGIVQAWVPVKELEQFAALDIVREIAPPDYGIPQAGTVSTEGDAILRSELVRRWSGLTGTGVNIGVIDVGLDSMATAQGNGDLPSNIEVNPGGLGSGDHGTASLEIIHDIAPGASLAFSSGSSSLSFIESIEWLEYEAFDGEGADVIVGIVHMYGEPYFEDGPAALSAADALERGAVVIVAAGNHAHLHYEGTFVDDGDGFHAFSPNEIALPYQAPSLSRNSSVTLQWNDPYDGATTDYDLFVCPRGLRPTKFNIQNSVCATSNAVQNGDDRPVEAVSTNLGAFVDLFIHQHTAGDANYLELVVTRGGTIEQHGVPSGGIVGPAAVDGVIAVGAISSNYRDRNERKFYSNFGPSEIYFPNHTTRSKPDVVSVTDVSVSSRVSSGGGFSGSKFGGTSAATPHVAGIAALVLEAERLANPTSTRKEAADAVYETIVETAVDIGESGTDSETGAGRVDALFAVEATGQLDSVTFTVDSTGDGADDDTTDGSCDDGNGECTLRAAIEQANADAGGIIKFGIDGIGPHVIQPYSALPSVTQTLLIDGLSQAGASRGTIKVELDGTDAGDGVNGLTISADSSSVRGLAIENFAGIGISVVGASNTMLSENIVSGNGEHGVSVAGTSSDRIDATEITHNIIGADATGSTDVGNGGAGINLEYADEGSVLDNLISGNASNGIDSHQGKTWIVRNYIGTDITGIAALANDGSGIRFSNSSSSGSKVEENIIAFNGGDGVTRQRTGTDSVVVTRNSIHSNSGLGIDVGPDGVTANDPQDADSYENFPVLSSAAFNGDDFHVNGTLESSGGGVVIEFFSNATCDPTGYGEGHTWLGSSPLDPTSAGSFSFSLSTLRGEIESPQTAVGNYITAVAIDARITVTPILLVGASELSACIEATETLPLLDLSSTSLTPTEGGTVDYTIALAAQPASSVTVALSSEDTNVATVSTTSISFTTENWNQARTVTVTGVKNDDLSDAKTNVLHTLTVDGKSYDGQSVPVLVADDFPNLMVWGLSHVAGSEYDHSITLTQGESVTYEAVLTHKPESDVTVTTSSLPGWLSFQPVTFTFTPMDWNSPRSITLTGNETGRYGTRGHTYTHKVTIGDSEYVAAKLYVLVKDPDQVELSLMPDSITTSEGGTSTYTVALEKQPSEEVIIYLGSDDNEAARPWPLRLSFGPDNWNSPQTVSVTGVQDHDNRDESARIYHYDDPYARFGSDTLRFRGSISVEVSDQDIPAILVDPEEGVEVLEGQTNSLEVELWEEPSSDLTVTLASSDTGVLTVDPPTLTFTPENWADSREVTLTGVTGPNEHDRFAQVRLSATVNSNSYILSTVDARVRDKTNSSLSPPPTDPLSLNSAAVYSIGLTPRWNLLVTPEGVPSGASFSNLFGAVHSAQLTLLEEGSMASPGIESLAETGATSALNNEIANAENAAMGSVLSVLGIGAGSISLSNSISSSGNRFTSSHPRVTLLSRITPSPDWFVGVAGLLLLDDQGNWQQSVQVNLYPWDAGTENGTEFSSANAATSPQGVIANLRWSGQFSGKPIAVLSFTLQSVNLLSTGAPEFTGAAEVGEELTADISSISDPDGLTNPSFTYHWIRVGSGGSETEVAGPLSSPTYTIQESDVGSRLKVRVTFDDDNGNSEESVSGLTPEITVVQVSVSFGSSTYYASEGGNSTAIQVLLNRDPRRAVTMPLSTSRHGGASPADYAAPTSVSFSDGETSKDVVVIAIDDTVDDDGESIELRFGSLPNGVTEAQPNVAVVQIQDNDHIPVTLSWELTALTAEEPTSPGTTSSVTLTAVAYTSTDKQPDVGFSFDYRVATSTGTARSPTDFEAISMTATFGRNDFTRRLVSGHYRYEATHNYAVSIEHDIVDESAETFQVHLSFVETGLPYLVRGAMAATVTVTDDIASLADLQTMVTAGAGSAARSDELTYDWTVSNSGPASSTNTMLTARLDEGTNFSLATPAGQCRRSGNDVTCSLGTIDAGDSATGSIVVQVKDTAFADLDLSLTSRGDQLDRMPGDNAASVHTELDAPPEKVTDFQVVSGNTFVDLTWKEPADNGSPISRYIVERKSGTDDFAPISPNPLGGTTSHRDEGVELDIQYTYRMRAVNEDGDGNWSQEGVATPGVTPPPPKIISGGGGGGFGPAPVAPKFTEGFGTTRQLHVTARPGDAIGGPVSATHPDELEVTYSIGGKDAALFDMDEETGQLRMKEGMTPVVGNTYTVNLTATDSAGFGAIIIVTIVVGEAIHHRYDLNRNGHIERNEVIAAVADYFDRAINKGEVIEVVKLYFSASA